MTISACRSRAVPAPASPAACSTATLYNHRSTAAAPHVGNSIPLLTSELTLGSSSRLRDGGAICRTAAPVDVAPAPTPGRPRNLAVGAAGSAVGGFSSRLRGIGPVLRSPHLAPIPSDRARAGRRRGCGRDPRPSACHRRRARVHRAHPGRALPMTGRHGAAVAGALGDGLPRHGGPSPTATMSAPLSRLTGGVPRLRCRQ